MDEGTGRKRLGRYFPHMVAATTGVTVAPVLVVSAVERAGLVDSVLVSTLLGVVLSVVIALLGSALWMRKGAARDLVFGDLMVWGYWRRIRNEREVAEMIDLLEGADTEADRPEMAPERRIEILQKLAAALEVSDPYTHGHTRRVARHAESIARAMRLPHATVVKIRTAAAVHDVGKMHVSDDVLNKPGKLSDEEFEIMKLHSVHGAEMVAAVGDPELTALVRHHHERIDGRGYPDRLAGEDIPLGARIIAVADTFDAITSSRVYRSATHHRKAIEILKKEAGSQLDQQAVEAFLSYYSGRSSIEWWAVVTTAPQRLLARALTALQQAGPSSLAGSAGATGLAALITGAALVAPVASRPEPAKENRGAQTIVSQVAHHDLSAGGGALSPDGTKHVPKKGSKTKQASHGSKAGSDKTKGGGESTKPGGGSPTPGTGTGTTPGTDAAPPSGDGGATPDPGGGSGVGEVVDDVTDPVDGVVDDVTDTVDGVGDGVGGVVDGAGDAVDDVLGGVLGGL
ncbi:MAG: HD-GYP domain-containing protein [Actinomycetota bacterium]|nr:HD-GYP domain-containing protein [Actinomycetota bacterium]